jgi:lycopene cyclase domain-containing protein
MGLLYLLALLVSITGMVVLDRRFTLFFFLVWDLAGIGLGIFFRGETSFMTGLQLAPELPIEELFFLTLLCYLSMNLFGFLTRAHSRPGGARETAGP